MSFIGVISDSRKEERLKVQSRKLKKERKEARGVQGSLNAKTAAGPGQTDLRHDKLAT
jgi:hypothetical protein